MATYLWNSLLDNEVIAFDPASDVLRFDSVSISAAAVSVTPTTVVSGEYTEVVFAFGGKTVTLEANPKTFTTSSSTGAACCSTEMPRLQRTVTTAPIH